MKKENNFSNHFSMQFILILILFLVVAIMSVMIIILGKDIYNNINEDRKSNYDMRVSLSYIGNKFRQADKRGTVYIKNIEGTSAAVIKETYDGINYETWIYYYDKGIYEILIDEGSPFNLSDGMKIMEVNSFDIVKVDDGFYKFTFKSDDETQDLVLSLYSQGN